MFLSPFWICFLGLLFFLFSFVFFSCELMTIFSAMHISSLCTLLLSQLLVQILYLCVDDFLIYCMFAFTGELSHFLIFLFLVVTFSFLPTEVPLAFVVKMVCGADFIYLFLSVKLLISLSNLNKSLAGQSILSCRFFPFTNLNISCHSVWPAEFLLKNQLMTLCRFPCM